jgi:hypothetical protein
VRFERNLIKSHRRPGNPSTFQPSAPLSPLRAMSADKLEALLAIISSGVGEIKQAYASAGEPVPDPDAPYVPDHVEPGVETSKALVVAAALQLIAAVGNPGKILIDAVCGVRPRGQLESDADVKPMGGKMLVTEALGVVLKLHVPEIVREAGPEVCSKFSIGFASLSTEIQGISAHDIAAKAHTSPDKLGTDRASLPARPPLTPHCFPGRFMRFLASRHIFKVRVPACQTMYFCSPTSLQELRPGVFVHNRLSSALDSKKQYESLASECAFSVRYKYHELTQTDFVSPLSKFDRPEGVSAFLGHLCVLCLSHRRGRCLRRATALRTTSPSHRTFPPTWQTRRGR